MTAVVNPAVLYGGGSTVYSSRIPATRHDATKYLGADYTILITDPNLVVVGDPLQHWSSLQATLRWKEPGSGQIVTPAHRYVREQIKPGNRVVIIRSVYGKSEVLISGPIEQFLRERSDDGENGGVGILTITFADDMAWLGARVTYPDPAAEPKAQTVDYFTRKATNAVQAMYDLVRLNAGQNARPERRVPRLVTAAYAPIAGTVNVDVKTRFEKITDVLRTVATRGVGTGYDDDSLGFSVKQVGRDLLFQAKRSTDLTGQVVFGFSVGNLQYYAFDIIAPEVTHPIVGGQGTTLDSSGTGGSRYVNIYPSKDPDNLSWGRYESFEAMDGSSGETALAAHATTVLAEHGQSGRLASNASDTPDQRFGVHYGIGDMVSIELDPGAYVNGPVQTVSLQAYPTAGEVVGVTVGTQAARQSSSYVRMLRVLDRRVGDLERITTPSRP